MAEANNIITKQFLEALQQKLKVGNRRGVHLNAIPTNSFRKIDICNWDLIDTKLKDNFIQKLLSSPKFKFKVSFEKIDQNKIEEDHKAQLVGLSKKLNKLSYQVDDIFKEKGISTFGFGYPIIIKRSKSDNKVIVSPLIIWKLSLKVEKSINTWTIQKQEEDPIYLNEVFINYVEKDEKIEIDKLSDEILDDGIVDSEELSEIVFDTLNNLSHQKLDDDYGSVLSDKFQELESVPTRQKADEVLNHNPLLVNAGGFSIYENQKEGIIEDFNGLISEFDASDFSFEEVPTSEVSTICSVPTDPSQQGLLNELNRKNNLIIQGPPGTGKSQSLTATLINALANNRRTMVVCEKQTALEVLKNNLKDYDLDRLSVIIYDVKKDRKKVVDSVRHRLERLHPTSPERKYQELLKDCKKLIAKANKERQILRKNILDQDNWTNVVGRYLKVKIENLEIELPDDNFEFSYKEFHKINNQLNTLEDIYQSYEPFEKYQLYDPAVYKGDNPYEIEDQLKKDYKDDCEKLAGRILDHEEIIEGTKDELLQIYQLYFDELTGLLTIIKNLAGKYQQNNWFWEISSITRSGIKLLALASPKYKLKLEDHEKFIQTMHDLFKKSRQGPKSFDVEYDHKDIKLKLSFENALVFDKQITKWKDSWPSLIKQKIKEINLGLDSWQDDIPLHIQDSLKNLLSEFNDIKDHYNLERKGTIQDILDLNKLFKQCDEYWENSEIFELHHQWYSGLNELNSTAQELVEKFKPLEHSWSRMFSAYYLNKILIKNASKDLPKSDKILKDIESATEQVGNSQIQFIKDHWKNLQYKNTTRFDRKQYMEVKNLYNKRKSDRHKRLSLKDIIAYDFELFVSFFPIVLTTPENASNLFRGQKEAFDLVMFDEASQLKIEDTICAMIKGKQKIVSGDEHQMPPSNYFAGEAEILMEDEEPTAVEIFQNDLLSCESLLEFAEQFKFDRRFLDFHYRSYHPYLVDFSNAAFYKGRLLPMPAKEDYAPITFVNVNGTYSGRTNEREALEVVRILKDVISIDDSGKYPSVGVGTFNLDQRNLILDKIREYSLRDEEFSSKITELEKQGLFVKNLENIQGDERDIMILTTTFGPDKDNKFAQRFGPILYQKGYKLLNVLVTRAKYHCFVCTSFPLEKIGNYEAELVPGSNTGKGILYAYLAYAKAVSDQNEQKRQRILEVLSNNDGGETDRVEGTSDNYTESPFEEEILIALESLNLDCKIHSQYQFTGFRIDFVLESSKEGLPLIAIECDGATYHSNREAYLYDIYRQRILEGHGFIFHRIISTIWWKRNKQETKRIKSFIEETWSKKSTYRPATHAEQILNKGQKGDQKILF